MLWAIGYDILMYALCVPLASRLSQDDWLGATIIGCECVFCIYRGIVLINREVEREFS